MKNINSLETLHYAIIAIALARIAVTIYLLVANPFDMQLRFFQIILIIVYASATISYGILFSNGVPIFSVIIPTAIHMIVIYLFQRHINLYAFAIVILLDIVYITIRSFKASLYPFRFEKEETEEDLVSAALEVLEGGKKQ